jgi:hypothetical protein
LGLAIVEEIIISAYKARLGRLYGKLARSKAKDNEFILSGSLAEV